MFVYLGGRETFIANANWDICLHVPWYKLRVVQRAHLLLYNLKITTPIVRSSMAKLYKGLASQCANAGQDASPTTGAEAVRDSGIHSEEILQPYPSAPTSGPAVT